DVVDLLGDRGALFDVLELHRAGIFGNDRPVVRIPVGEVVAGLDGLAVSYRQHRAVRHLVAFALTLIVVLDDHLAGARNHDLVALGVLHVAHRRREARGPRRLRFHVALYGGPAGRTADMEGTHRELSSRFADRLRGNHANR